MGGETTAAIYAAPAPATFALMRWERPAPDEMAPYYHRYVDNCSGDDLLAALRAVATEVTAALRAVPIAKGDHRYADGKWTVKEVVQHMIDAERVFAYRALRFARNDATELPGFEENDWAPESRAGRRSLADLVDEYERLSTSTLDLFRGFDPAVQQRHGTANKQRMSVRAAGWVIAGHALHHVRVLRERYLIA